MKKITAYQLPGFYMDARGAYGVIIGTMYISCFINDNGEYDVTRDAVDENGDFCKNINWESFREPQKAVAALRRMVRVTAIKALDIEKEGNRYAAI